MSQTMVQVKKSGEKKKRGVSGVKRGDPNQPSANIPPQDRETRIDFTLDMVLNDLIQQGHMNPANSYMFKTQEMKEHIGRMCDRVHRRKHGFPEKDPVTPVTPKPAVTGNNDDQSSNENVDLNQETQTLTLKKKSSKVKKQDSATTTGKPTKKPSRKRSTSKTRKEKTIQPTAKESKAGKIKKAGTAGAAGPSVGVAGVDSSILHLEPIDRVLMKTPITLQPGAAFQRMNEKFDPEKYFRNADVQTYRATVDLRGFADDHISLELDGRRLIIVAQRPQNEELKLNARKVIEIIDIPEGITLTNLKIGRGSDGSLLVEESA